MENEPCAYSAQLVKENEVPMVSMDGEAHPEITLAAIGLGIVAASLILITLIVFVTRRKRQLFENMENGARQLSAAKPSGPEVITISQQVDSRSSRGSQVTICTDVITEI
ncbi:uncharacterized protein LOC129762100 [Toxorhynchites rutilus septentrionalis]|uniref:uncharacterized protein LOC129762100 n=1 Tax=Toxorhynchites rutilus septentrionalis TaxID=329112 RepID=UPI0024796D78|nr:uncharacterized protein LOC129762100 [Toxorhynchites rutilus septentrionalis]